MVQALVPHINYCKGPASPALPDTHTHPGHRRLLSNCPRHSQKHSHYHVSLTHNLCFQDIPVSSSHSLPDSHGEGLGPPSQLVRLLGVLSAQQLWSWLSLSSLECFRQTICHHAVFKTVSQLTALWVVTLVFLYNSGSPSSLYVFSECVHLCLLPCFPC